jgi:hypothetical protein
MGARLMGTVGSSPSGTPIVTSAFLQEGGIEAVVASSSRLMDDPNHWRNRAEEARVQADQLNEPQA